MISKLYEQLNDSANSENQEQILKKIFTKFLENYNQGKINSKNFVDFKEDTYLVFNGLYHYLFQEDINNEEDITQEEIDKFNYIKNHVEYIINNIKYLEYEDKEENPIYISLEIVIRFVTESLENITGINEIFANTTKKLQNFSENIEMNLKLREIMSDIKTGNNDNIQEYRIILDGFLKTFTLEQKLEVIKDIENNIDYQEQIKNCKDDNLINYYNNLLMLQNIINLKSHINKIVISNI